MRMPTERNIFERIRNRPSPLAAVADSVMVFRYGVSAPILLWAPLLRGIFVQVA